MDHYDMSPWTFPLPDGDSVDRVVQAAQRLYLRMVLVDLIRHLPGAFDDDRACPYCAADTIDPRGARLLRLDLGRLGYGDGVVLLCPGCGFEEEG